MGRWFYLQQLNHLLTHHVKPLYRLDEETIPNPATDMVCLSPNCHRMIHRKKDGIMMVDELKEIINRQSRENRK